ncbi:MAG TPA: hypothetical protein PLX18_09755 [Anaerohalosphaeraceae bacterium]|nr:hypothetical protein [Anaerohalosphaeraceae bacterium]HQG06612.1 hypothetical protein [Anaerohalosphaeraceae bacterium]HQI08123.1 hypothetical protein [Anaerohalosphaeraceae bacterium]HQJ68463.1 hypothetical protein [Anaerohalosphaeraceae bacterium]
MKKHKGEPALCPVSGTFSHCQKPKKPALGLLNYKRLDRWRC